MTFYLIGTGLNLQSVSLEAFEILRRCSKIYMETYTVELPYEIFKLEEKIGKRITPLTRTMVEDEKFVEEAKRSEIGLLVYGSPLIATTHISLLLKCKKEKIKFRILHNASIIDAITESGLQYYKFGKTCSMPTWNEKYKPDSFVQIIHDNKNMGAHSLVLVDIGLLFTDALRQLVEACKSRVKLEKIVVCSKLGTEDSKIVYASLEKLGYEEIHAPFCFIIPGKLHFIEEEFLEKL